MARTRNLGAFAWVLSLAGCQGGGAHEPTTDATTSDATTTGAASTGVATTEPTTTGATTTVEPTTTDGTTDATSDTSGECAPGEQRSCYSHPDPDTANHGPCHAGWQDCRPDGEWGVCEGEVVPAAEDCATDEDEDCDGLGPAADPDCSCTPGAIEKCAVDGAFGLCVYGQRTCGVDTFWGPCESIVAPAPGKCALEFPHQKDYDCDGYIGCGEHDWSVRFGGPSYDFAGGVAVAPDGDLWIGGGFQQTIDLGGGPLVAVDEFDAFVARLDPSGGHLWSRRYGESRRQGVSAVRVDGHGDVVIGGGFNGPIDLGGGVLFADEEFSMTFLAKLKADGEHAWSIQMGSSTQLTGVELDGLGAPVQTGFFYDYLFIDELYFDGKGLEDFYFARHDPATGSPQLARAYGDSSMQYVFAVAVDPASRIVLTGSLQGTIDLGGAQLSGVGPQGDAFVVSLDADGLHRWSGAFGGTGADYGTGVAVAPGGDVLLVGVFESSIDLGGGTLVSAGDRDVFAARFDAAGNHLWSRRFGDAATQQYIDVAVDSHGDVVLFGAFEGTIDLGGGPLKSAGGLDVFVAKLDASGGHVWSRRAGDAANQSASDLAFDAGGRVLVIGHFAGSVDFGGGKLASAGAEDIFLARFLP